MAKKYIQNFNTSHVSINPLSLPSPFRNSRNFNTSHVSINHTETALHNASRWISIHLMFLLIIDEQATGWNRREHFNTSHVSINLICIPGNRRPHVDFNTSHVSINLWSALLLFCPKVISIHLMFLLIGCAAGIHAFWILISIHLMFLLISKGFRRLLASYKFQYISCFY